MDRKQGLHPGRPDVPSKTIKKPRKYSGPPKGSQEAKDRMARVRPHYR